LMEKKLVVFLHGFKSCREEKKAVKSMSRFSDLAFIPFLPTRMSSRLIGHPA
jgi:hypothetical protein